MDNYVVCGGGFIGLLLAKSLANLDLKITIYADKLEPKDLNFPMVYALNAASINLLKTIGLDFSINYPVKYMQVVDQQHEHSWQFSYKKIKQPYIACIVNAQDMYNQLLDCCLTDSNINIISNKILEVKSEDRIVIDALGNSSEFSFLFAADGKNSWVRSQVFGDDLIKSIVNQIAIIATVRLNKPILNTAWQKFLITGPVALLPKANNEYALIWSVASDVGKKLLDMPTDEFVNELEQITAYEFGEIEILSKLYSMHLESHYAPKIYQDNCFLIGDAARVILPLFGQGANLGCLDIIAIINLIKKNHHNFGFHYQQQRFLDGLIIGKTADLINSNTCWQNSIMAQFRGKLGSGLLAIEEVERYLLSFALGSRSYVDNSNFSWPDY